MIHAFHHEPTGEHVRAKDHDDTFVIDIYDRPEDDVQVRLNPNGPWHRKAIGGTQTACGYPLGGYATREDSYETPLCELGCYSPHELSFLRVAKPK